MKNCDYPKAKKLFEKSLRLYPLPGVEALLSQVERMEQQRQQQQSSRAPPAAARALSTASNGSSTSNANNTGADGRAYTEEQVQIVKQVLRAKEGGRGAHYRVLGLQTRCTESEIKKAYRKLSLKVHPDKNSAPHSDEAFKAVGLAYATLSDPQKRTIYDRYGEEDPDNRGGGMGGMRAGGGRGMHMNGQDVSPEEIFNMFFGGMQGMNGGGPGGFHVYSSGFGPGMQFRAGQQQRHRRQDGTTPNGQQQQQRQQDPNPMAILFQLLPMLLIMLVSFMRFNDGDGVTHVTSSPGEYKYFSLTVRTTMLVKLPVPFHTPDPDCSFPYSHFFLYSIPICLFPAQGSLCK
jgi:DnaJ homolog subfamily B member 12